MLRESDEVTSQTDVSDTTVHKKKKMQEKKQQL